jgi:NAD(P)-dependent dehydrogenase (short-subunit alcohol dehydrogenase family)
MKCHPWHRCPYYNFVIVGTQGGLAAAIVNRLVRRRSRVYVLHAAASANWAKAALNGLNPVAR